MRVSQLAAEIQAADEGEQLSELDSAASQAARQVEFRFRACDISCADASKVRRREQEEFWFVKHDSGPESSWLAAREYLLLSHFTGVSVEPE